MCLLACDGYRMSACLLPCRCVIGQCCLNSCIRTRYLVCVCVSVCVQVRACVCSSVCAGWGAGGSTPMCLCMYVCVFVRLFMRVGVDPEEGLQALFPELRTKKYTGPLLYYDAPLSHSKCTYTTVFTFLPFTTKLPPRFLSANYLEIV